MTDVKVPNVYIVEYILDYRTCCHWDFWDCWECLTVEIIKTMEKIRTISNLTCGYFRVLKEFAGSIPILLVWQLEGPLYSLSSFPFVCVFFKIWHFIGVYKIFNEFIVALNDL